MVIKKKELDFTFINLEEKFKGKPDYIFINQNQVFAVEEKYIYKRDPNKASYDEIHDIDDPCAEQVRLDWKNYQPYFHKNHEIQLISYIRNIKDYNITFGYLIYWYYDFRSYNNPYIHKIGIKKISHNAHSENAYQVCKKNISDLKSKTFQTFDANNLNLNKCSACAVNKYCGHKTSTITKLNYPYDKNDMIITNAPFPDELKNETGHTDNHP